MIETVDDIKTIANVGTGTMGHAITLQFALSGYPVHLVGRGEASLEKAMKAIRSDAEDFAEAGLLKDGDTLDAVLARITGYADYASGVADVDFVIESVAENLDIKKSVWAEVEHAAPKDAILSTNTSGLSPTALQSVLKKPERFVVAHFWNPAQLMPLVEVVPGEKTDPKVVDITFDLMAKIGKKPAKIKKESLGFVGNRLQLAVLREAFYIVQQGIADAATVDDVMKYSLGRRWNLVGPLASIDLGGLDVFYNISTYLFDDMDNGTGPRREGQGRQSRRQNRPGLLLLAGRGRQAHHRIPQQGPAARAEERRRGCRRCAGVRHKYQGSVTTMTSTEHSTRADMLAHMGSLQQAAYVRPIEY